MQATIITTDQGSEKLWQEETVQTRHIEEYMRVINLYPDIKEQEITGFGGAFTEAAAHCYASLSEAGKRAVMEGYYSDHGLRYNMGRVPIHSCDFSLGNYTYIEEGDKELKTFTIDHDEKEILPMMRQALLQASGQIDWLCVPWSPPAFMKSNSDMNHGGSLLEEYKESWAAYFVRFIEEYRKRGISFRYVNVQNEPQAAQTWDSCIYSALEEGDFVTRFLAPAFKKSGLDDIGIFIWDHNKEGFYQRIKETFQVEGCREQVTGASVHWYTGDHFDAIRAVRKAYPELKIFFTEGCVEYSRFAGAGEVQKAEMYAHDMLGDLKAGCHAILDWNLLLDENGGPNHVGNFCAAPMMSDGKGGVERHLSYYYIGHFSRYIQKGAIQIMTSSYTNQIETVAFINPGGSRTAVLLNRTDMAAELVLREETACLPVRIAPHGIVTVIL